MYEYEISNSGNSGAWQKLGFSPELVIYPKDEYGNQGYGRILGVPRNSGNIKRRKHSGIKVRKQIMHLPVQDGIPCEK